LTDALKPPRDLSALSALAPELALAMARVASDIALVIDEDGVIRSVAEGPTPLAPACADWTGQRWVDTATGDSRSKVERLLAEARSSGIARRREVNHPGRTGSDDIPVSWAAVRLGERGPVVAVGRDLRAVAAIQQRFVDAQQELERDYWRRRQAESRYRLLFQAASDAVFVLDAGTLDVLDANDAALTLLGQESGTLVGRPLGDSLGDAARPAMLELLASARTGGQAGEIRLRSLGVGGGAGASDVAVTPFRVDGALHLLVRARRDPAAPLAAAEFVEQTPDAVVITDSNGRIQFANRAFLAVVGRSQESQLLNRALPDLLGDVDGAWHRLLARTRLQGIVSRSPLHVRVAGASPLAVEVSSTLMAEGEQEGLGFTLRPVAAPKVPVPPSDELLHGLGGLLGQIGRLPLDDLLAELGQLAERHLVESAIARAGGRTEVAAELLGVTLESLQMRLRRHGLSAYVYSGPDGSPRSIN
jgi:transcriptional regulator PpsR